MRTWKPVVAGVLNIVSGVLSLLGFLGVIAGIIAVGSGPFFWDSIPGLGPLEVGFMQSVLVIMAIFLAVVGILPLLGGIYALQRRKWALALAGSIAAIFGSALLGILATIFTALSKDEFEQ